MKEIESTSKKVVLLLTQEEFRSLGFDAVWDNVRTKYPENKYKIESSRQADNDKSTIITLLIKNNMLEHKNYSYSSNTRNF